MGPVIICDKSAFQSFSPEECRFLGHHYLVNLVPIFLIEVLADLKKSDDPTAAGAQVTNLVRKIPRLGTALNTYYQDLCIGNLFGYPIEMDSRPVVSGAIPIVDEQGERGHYLPEPPEKEALRRWEEGDFSANEQLLAERWREANRTVDVELFQRQMKLFLKSHPKPKSLPDLASYIDARILNGGNDYRFLQQMFDSWNASADERRRISSRWRKTQPESLKKFAPYAFYCFRLEMIFYWGIGFEIVGTRKTNRIDMEYFFYLPFSNIFCSGDKFHKDVFQVANFDGRVFVERDQLKADLKKISGQWERLNADERKAWSYEYGDYPPQDDSSFTYQVWTQFMKPWQPGSGNWAMKMTPEQNLALLKMLKPKFDAVDRAERLRQVAMKRERERANDE